MILLYVICALAATGLVCLEASVLYSARHLSYPNWFPGLLAVAATVNLMFSILILRAGLVVSPEFGLAMMEGGVSAYLGILALVLLYALSLGLLVSAVRHMLGCSNWAVWSTLASLVVVALACAGVRSLDPGDSLPLQIVSYDLWWPPFVLWLLACLVEAALAVGQVESRMRRLCVHTFAAAAVALIAIQRPDFLEPRTQLLWQYIALIAFCLSAGLAPLSVWWTLRQPGGNIRPPRSIVIVTLACFAAIGLAWGTWPEDQDRSIWIQGSWIVWGTTAIAVAAAFGWQAYRSRRQEMTTPIPASLGQRVLMASAVLAIAASVLDLFYFDVVDPALALAGTAMGWAMLAEAAGGGFLSHCYRLLRERAPNGSRASAVLHWGIANLRKTRASIVHSVGRVFAASSLAGVLVKLGAGIVLLVALSEVPNAGTTIIGTFTVESDGLQKDTGLALSDNLVYALHTLNESLRSDIALVQGGASKSASFRFATANDGPANLGAALAKQPDMSVFGVNVPVGLLVAPIQAPMRWLLGVRVISGSIYTGPRYYTALAHSSSGDGWKAQIDLERRQSKCALGPERPLVRQIAGADGSSSAAGLDTKNSDIPETLPDLAEQLARQIITADGPSSAGMTRSSAALASFQCGWSAWQEFEAEKNPTKLDEAIKYFGEATKRDEGFSLAQYRLGRALQEAHQPGAAIEAFRASVATNPEFGAGLAAWASTLYDYNTFSVSQPATASTVGPGESAEQRRAVGLFRTNEAARHWQTMVQAPARRVSPLERASAYAGLCLPAYDEQISLDSANQKLDQVQALLGMLKPREAFQAWKAQEKRTLPEGKDATEEDTKELARLQIAQNKAFAPLTEALVELDKALTEYGARTADMVTMLKAKITKLSAQEPASEQDAVNITEEALTAIRDFKDQFTTSGKKTQSFRAYFYCRRADRIYAMLAASDRAIGDLRAGESLVAYRLGLTLESRNPYQEPPKPKWSCAIDNGYSRGPYSRAALKYYNQAVVLTPDDLNARCRVALTAAALGDPTRLIALDQDSDAHLNLAGQYLGDGEYEMALMEYAAAIERNRNSVDALNGYAYTFWALRYASSHKAAGPEVVKSPAAPEATKIDAEKHVLDIATNALDYADRAIALVDGKRPQNTEIMVHGTRGEVFLGRGEYSLALDELRKTLAYEAVKDRAEYNEVRWDLSQALLCIARKRDPTAELKSQPDVLLLLAEIKELESRQEQRPFSNAGLLGDAHSVCPIPGPASPPLAAASK